MGKIAATHAAILTMEKTVSQNVYVMRRAVIIKRGVNRKVMLIICVCKVKNIKLIYRDTKKNLKKKELFIYQERKTIILSIKCNILILNKLLFIIDLLYIFFSMSERIFWT